MPACGPKIDMQHAMSCKIGGFITIRHSNVRDLTDNLLTIICKGVDIEPQLLPVTWEAFHYQTSNTSNEARVDIRAQGFWERVQQPFFDVRVFDPNINRYVKAALPQCYVQYEKEKKRNYRNSVLQIEHGSFITLVFSMYGGMGRTWRTLYSSLAKLIADKQNITHFVAINWVRTKLSFALLKLCLLCLCGSRILNKNAPMVEDNIKISTNTSRYAQN